MARIRTIKPEFPQSETVGNISREARLLFIQLWTICDDSGRTRAASRMLASLLYPYDDDARDLIPAWLEELDRAGCIRLYQVDGQHYLDIPKWLSHQKIDRPSASKFPGFDEGSRVLDEPSRKIAQDQGRDQGPGPEEEEAGAGAPSSPTDEEEAFEEFAACAGEFGWPKPRGLEADRRKKLRARLAEHGLEGWRQMLANARASDFLRRKFALKLDWVLEPKNFRKVLEGNYGAACSSGTPSPSADEVLWGARLKDYVPGGFWQETTWGPRPESGLCLAPHPALERWRGRVAQ